MSCGLHDAVRLESRGVPTAVFGSAPFRHEAEEQAAALAMPDHRLIETPHPVQPLAPETVAAYADDVIDQAVAWLTTANPHRNGVAGGR